MGEVIKVFYAGYKAKETNKSGFKAILKANIRNYIKAQFLYVDKISHPVFRPASQCSPKKSVGFRKKAPGLSDTRLCSLSGCSQIILLNILEVIRLFFSVNRKILFDFKCLI